MASLSGYGSRMREAKMFMLVLLVSQTKLLSLCVVTGSRVSVTLRVSVFELRWIRKIKQNHGPHRVSSPVRAGGKVDSPSLNLGHRFGRVVSAVWVDCGVSGAGGNWIYVCVAVCPGCSDRGPLLQRPGEADLTG